MQQSREPPTATGMGEFLNHLQKKDIHKDTATVPAPINEVQDWHLTPSGYASYSCTQSWVTWDTSVPPQQQRNCLGLCSLPWAMPCFNVLSSKILSRTQMQEYHHHHSKYRDTGLIQNYSSETAKLRDHILPLSHKSLKGHVI